MQTIIPIIFNTLLVIILGILFFRWLKRNFFQRENLDINKKVQELCLEVESLRKQMEMIEKEVAGYKKK